MFCDPGAAEVCPRTGLIAGTAFAMDCAGQADVCACLERVTVFQEVVTSTSEVVTKSMEVVTETAEVVNMIPANHRNQKSASPLRVCFEKIRHIPPYIVLVAGM